MSKFPFVCLAFLCLISLQSEVLADQAASARRPEKIAFVVGVGNYNDPSLGKLDNPANDARLIAKSLESIQFTIHGGKALIDPSAEELRNSFLKFSARLNDQSQAVIYFAGHGIQVGGENLMIPADFKLPESSSDHENARSARLQSLQLGQILSSLEESKAALSVILLDCCRDNGFSKKIAGMIPDAGLAAPATQSSNQGELIIGFAAKHGQTAIDGEGQNSPFAFALAKRLVIPGQPLRKILDEVTTEVLTNTQQQQRPFFYGSLRGDIYLAGLPTGIEQIASDDQKRLGSPKSVPELVAGIEMKTSQVEIHARMGKPGKSKVISMKPSKTSPTGQLTYESYATAHYGMQFFYTKQTANAPLALIAYTVHLHQGQEIPIYRGGPDNTILILGRTKAGDFWKENPPSKKTKFVGGGRAGGWQLAEHYFGRKGGYMTWLVPASTTEYDDGGKIAEGIPIRSIGFIAESDAGINEVVGTCAASPISEFEE